MALTINHKVLIDWSTSFMKSLQDLIKPDGQLPALCYELANMEMCTEMKSIFSSTFLSQKFCSQMNTEYL